MKNKLIVTIATVSSLLMTSCAPPRGSSWAVGDFNKSSENYAEFPVGNIAVGMSRDKLVSELSIKYELSEVGDGYEILSFKKWKAVSGPDYVEKILFVKMTDGKVERWKIENQGTTIVPRTW